MGKAGRPHPDFTSSSLQVIEFATPHFPVLRNKFEMKKHKGGDCQYDYFICYGLLFPESLSRLPYNCYAVCSFKISRG